MKPCSERRRDKVHSLQESNRSIPFSLVCNLFEVYSWSLYNATYCYSTCRPMAYSTSLRAWFDSFDCIQWLQMTLILLRFNAAWLRCDVAVARSVVFCSHVYTLTYTLSSSAYTLLTYSIRLYNEWKNEETHFKGPNCRKYECFWQRRAAKHCCHSHVGSL
jgi:hypothetical protein